MTLKGKVVLITGLTRGIGKEFAIGFAKEGADLIINGRNLGKAKGVAKEMESFGVRSMAIGADVSLFKDVTRMVDEQSPSQKARETRRDCNPCPVSCI